MSDFLDELWSHFAEETAASVASIVSLINTARDNDGRTDSRNMTRLFRLVGELCRAMEIDHAHALADVAADIPLAVFDTDHDMQPSTIKLLDDTIDELKNRLQNACATRTDLPENRSLLDALLLERNRYAQATPSDPEQDMTEQAPTPLYSDPGALIFFGDIVAEWATPLLAPLSVDYNGAGHTRDSALAAIDALEQASRGIGFDNAEKTFSEMKECLPDGQVPDPEYLQKYLGRISFIHLMLSQVQADLDIEAGATVLTMAAAPIVAPGFRTLMTRTVATIADAGSSMTGDKSNAIEINKMLKELDDHIRLISPGEQLHSLILTLRDIYSRITLGEIEIDKNLNRTALGAITIAETAGIEVLEQGRTNACEDEILDAIESLKSAAQNVEGRGSDGDFDESLANLGRRGVKQEFLEILTPENIHDLLPLLDNGASLYEMTVDLESDEGVTERFVDWMGDAAHSVTSRTMLIDGHSWFEFLIASSEPEEQITETVRMIDPAQTHITFNGRAIVPGGDH